MSLYYNIQYRKDLECTYQSAVSIDLLRKSSVLITGANGLIGSYLAESLLYCNETRDFGCQIFAAGRDERKLKQRFAAHLDNENLHFLTYNVMTPITWEVSVDYIIHCAGNAYPYTFMKKPAETLIGSLSGVERLLTYGQKNNMKRFIYLSSGEIYGQAVNGISGFYEKDSGGINNMNIRSCYPIGKCAAENLCAAFFYQYGVESVVARLCHTYGPTGTKEDHRVAQDFVRTVLGGHNIVMKSKGQQRRSWCYVADAASAILTLLCRGAAGQAYNVATPISRATIREMSEIVAGLGQRQVEFELPKEAETAEFNPMELAVLASDKLEELGWYGRYTLEQGMRHTIECYKSEGAGV